MQNTAFSTNKTLNISGRLADLSEPRIMGILNITPDSFYDGGKYNSEKTILKHTEQMLEQGATFIDVGGYSSRPGAEDISVEEEAQRVCPVIKAISNKFPEAIISVDTFRAEIARLAIGEGAHMINDISGGTLDPAMFNTAANLGVPYVLMHMKGNPQTMTRHTAYDNLVKEILDYFHQKIQTLQETGIKDIIIDPGFGFAKTREQSFELLSRLDLLRIAGKPILVGLSRKSMVWKTLNAKPDDALNGTTVLNTVAILKGANILRVHDVQQASEVIQLLKALSYTPYGSAVS